MSYILTSVLLLIGVYHKKHIYYIFDIWHKFRCIYGTSFDVSMAQVYMYLWHKFICIYGTSLDASMAQV